MPIGGKPFALVSALSLQFHCLVIYIFSEVSSGVLEPKSNLSASFHVVLTSVPILRRL